MASELRRLPGGTKCLVLPRQPRSSFKFLNLNLNLNHKSGTRVLTRISKRLTCEGIVAGVTYVARVVTIEDVVSSGV